MNSLYQYVMEKHNNNKYDGLREYCLREQVNEEYARTAIRKTYYSRKIKIAVLDKLRKWNMKNRSIRNNEKTGTVET